MRTVSSSAALTNDVDTDKRRRTLEGVPAPRPLTFGVIEGAMSERCYHGMEYRGMLLGVKVDKLSVSFEPDLGDAVRSAAAQAGKPVSSWLAAEEVARAERELGLAAGDTAA